MLVSFAASGDLGCRPPTHRNHRRPARWREGRRGHPVVGRSVGVRRRAGAGGHPSDTVRSATIASVEMTDRRTHGSSQPLSVYAGERLTKSRPDLEQNRNDLLLPVVCHISTPTLGLQPRSRGLPCVACGVNSHTCTVTVRRRRRSTSASPRYAPT